jgi:hypothetical protein
MKARAVCGLATLVVAATAGWRCGPATSGSQVVALPPGQEGGVTPPPSAIFAEIRMLGGGTHDFRSVTLGIERIAVEVNGAAADVRPDHRAIDLASTSASVLGRFALPARGSKVHVALTLAAEGSWTRVGSAGPIDARGIPITFDATAEPIIARGAVEIRIDLGTSLVPDGAGKLALLPNLDIRF